MTCELVRIGPWGAGSEVIICSFVLFAHCAPLTPLSQSHMPTPPSVVQVGTAGSITGRATSGTGNRGQYTCALMQDRDDARPR